MPVENVTGSCYCKAIAYSISDVESLPLDGIICHCRTCQKIATMGSYNVTLNREQLKITKGELASYEDNSADSGKTITRMFCKTCGSGIYSRPDSIPDKLFLKAGTLDDMSQVRPNAEIYVERAIKGMPGSSEEIKCTLFEGMMKNKL
ncbi:hypothetical protein FFLO_01649 [Filobasidium floriforme]|uniref:CENP-V/GFA domain-containing protein n=1 Tax=Filobasidium floriforme TaxID=5210 RepID=A0A8K0JPM6_9TREE|nr:glutathione-dependent formaldehyde-activating GFA [Filobasidium floriforme]KAG7562959.1 hypothetical protein FFLO_01649 [Filobasidium floriforme]KAH8080588.1 glutathione-dependent formaldehyde-activating GFA [Filobasidium floriforme]